MKAIKSMTRSSMPYWMLGGALLFVAACAPSNVAGDDDGTNLPPAMPGHAYLTIVGDSNVFLDGGAQTNVTVKYHDEDGHPLAGEVSFAVVGTPHGGNVGALSGVTNAQGEVTVAIIGGDEAAFQVTASADYALPVAWNVAVAAGTPELAPLDPAGTYEVESQFDLATGLPGTVGTVVNTIIDMTDDPTDPATWLIDAALTQIGNNTLKNIVNSFRPLLDGYVNDLILQNAPDFVNTLVNLGNDFGQVARKFGTVSTLEIKAGSGPDGVIYTANHSIDGFQFMIDGAVYEYSRDELQLPVIEADGIAVTLESETKISVDDHALPVSYGQLLLFALDNVIIPNIDPYAHNMRELLEDQVDCTAIGQAISDYVGIGSPGTYAAACHAGLGVAAGSVEAAILQIDSTGAALHIHGEARPVDTTGDRKVDKLNAGLWEGSMAFGPLTSVLAKPNQKFTGKKMGVTP